MPSHLANPVERRFCVLSLRTLRAAVGVGLMLLACIGGMRQRTVTSLVEFPAEIQELRHEFEAAWRSLERRERLQRGQRGAIVAPLRAAADVNAGPRAVPARSSGHRLANGLCAPLRC